MATVVEGDFEWDQDKAASTWSNTGSLLKRRRPSSLTRTSVDLDDGSGLERMLVIGTSLRERVLCVVHVECAARDRIISARPATSAERDVYETGGNP
jgi:hypothetical protein